MSDRYKPMDIVIPDLAQISQVFTRTALIFFFTFVILRLLGKKRLSQLSVIDLLLIISLGSAVGDVMIYGEETASIITSMIAIATVGVLIKLVDELVQVVPRLEKVTEGEATILIKNGRIDAEALKRENITQGELESMLREKGYLKHFHLKEVALEPDGQVSVIEK